MNVASIFRFKTMHFLIKFREGFNDHKIPFINEEPKSSHEDSVIQLPDLRQILEDFDAQSIYAKIHCDLTDKYNMAKEYYVALAELRKYLVAENKISAGDQGKERVSKMLDEVVSTMITDFTDLTNEKYAVLDEIFFMETNFNWNGNLDDLMKKVDKVVHKPEAIYNQEFEKMCKVHLILEEEVRRLLQIKNGD
ncbi:PREDICTED: uncharacterized protein LOC108562564 [Nicrophorus vespilloides]|uniref:Uncharacterized protein LOC108562564 n=1 Tax=Nicrophorus vespilloides TaxID=110193 RepID=A0ABM1MPD5_NICVS|nr:PREDICTED: uncharacterized protein LOC108562564 [Nicrophorus vespilloides]